MPFAKVSEDRTQLRKASSPPPFTSAIFPIQVTAYLEPNTYLSTKNTVNMYRAVAFSATQTILNPLNCFMSIVNKYMCFIKTTRYRLNNYQSRERPNVFPFDAVVRTTYCHNSKLRNMIRILGPTVNPSKISKKCQKIETLFRRQKTLFRRVKTLFQN